jgi:hypothetical protein
LLDANQPIYVLSGVLMPDPADELANRLVAKLRRRGRHSPEQVELSKKLLQQPSGWTALGEVLKDIGDAGGMVIFTLAEKRYAIAAKAVETYLDADYNPRVPSEFSFDANGRQDLADVIHALDYEVLSKFAVAYRARDAVALEAALESLVHALRGAGHTPLAEALEGAKGQGEEIASRELLSDSAGGAMPTLNMPVFASTMYRMESIARRLGPTPTSVVHDESKEFGPTMRWFFDLGRKAARGRIRLNSGAEMLLPFEALRDLRFAVSQDSAGIQIADLVARAICYPTRELLLNRALPAGCGGEPLKGLLATLIVGEGDLSHVISSRRFAREVLGRLFNS